MTAMRNWRFWLLVLLASASFLPYGYADGAWWGAIGPFTVGVTLVLAYYLGRRS